MSSGDVLKAMNKISTAARAIYNHLHIGNKWNLPGKHDHHAAATVNKCNNCGALEHLSPKCPKPCDEESARRLAKHEPKPETLREIMDKAVEAVVVVKVEQVVEILMGSMLLGMIIPRRTPTLELRILKVLGKCTVLNAVGGMKHTLPSIMMSSVCSYVQGATTPSLLANVKEDLPCCCCWCNLCSNWGRCSVYLVNYVWFSPCC
jgi:hypothetical protein